MDFSNLTGYPLIDGHIHYSHPDLMPGLIGVLDEMGLDRFNIVCTPERQRLSLVPDALHIKAHYPERIFVFGGMDVSALFMAPQQAGEIFADYVDMLLSLGCDGIKMIEGKPDMRKSLPIPNFDSPIYAPYWERIAERNVPLVFHVNDPEEFWDEDLLPDWALERGWYYGDGSYINNEDQYTQVLNVLERHPDIKVIFAHFFFLSAQLPRLAEYLDQFPGMHIDLTPGIEMYHNFSTSPDVVREFFMKYQDRIVYGTDIGAKALLVSPDLGVEREESQARVFVVRNFLETEGAYNLPGDGGFLFGKPEKPYLGIALPKDVLEKIYYKNFERLAGERPRALNPGGIVAECGRIIGTLGALSAVQPDEVQDSSVAERVMGYFQSQM
jgi:predicted TIM-barrel fold metal-dependent hydrolase